MLLRTVALFLLCVSVGLCATLGHYQSETEEKEVEAAEEAAAPQPGDSPAAEEPAADSVFGNVMGSIFAAGNPVAEEPVLDAQAVEEPGADSDGAAGDIPAEEVLPAEAADQKQPSSVDEEELNDIRPIQTEQTQEKHPAQEDNSWGLNSLRSGLQNVHGYFDSLVELVGGHNGVCQYRCRYGELPQPRPGYQASEPNGCSSSLVGFQLDLGIPAMTKCCNQLDVCYDTCGLSKYDCDSSFRTCLHDICSDINKSLGFASKVQACESMADTLFNTVWTLGCRPYMNSQRAACVCEGEEKDEL